jgi:hypothetical protein
LDEAMAITATYEPGTKAGNPLTVVSMVTENTGSRFRSTIFFRDGTSRVSYGENAKSAERNVLRDLNLDWSQLLPRF